METRPAVAEAGPAVAEEDISRWIQLPRQGSRGRAAHGVPSAEEPWQVQTGCAMLWCLCCAFDLLCLLHP